MRRLIRRFVVLAIGLTGLLAILAEPAFAGVKPNHCEPRPLEGGRR